MTRLDLFKNLKPGSYAIEVGTLQGDFAKEILNYAHNVTHLVCVDSWPSKFAQYRPKFFEGFGIEDKPGITTHSQSDGDLFWYFKTDQHKLFNTDSITAARWYERESATRPIADLVYIDAAHDYLSVYADIEAWWPVVKQGGILAGHDYEQKQDDGFWGPIEVRPAVDAWAKKHGLKVNKTDEHDCPSWWVVKP